VLVYAGDGDLTATSCKWYARLKRSGCQLLLHQIPEWFDKSNKNWK